MNGTCHHTCTEPAHEIRKKTMRNGLPMYGVQCVTCGRQVGAWLAKGDWPADAPEWDDGATRRHWNAQLAADQAARNEAKAAESAAWFSDHDAYLCTPQWESLRDRVRLRAGGLCEGCRQRNGLQAHHLTYVRWKRELLIDLAWLCKDCHDRAHEKRDRL